MNPSMRIHKDQPVENQQGSQRDKKQSLTLNKSGSKVGIPELTARCVGEINSFRRGEPGIDQHSLELLRRATVQGEQEARKWVQRCFSELVSSWVRRHPNRKPACEIESEEYYVAETFERFWQATALTQHIEFTSLAEALQYLQACLNGALIDSLRAGSQSREIPLADPGELEKVRTEDTCERSGVRDSLKKVIPIKNEQRLAYLLFHCGLKPRQIMRYYPREFTDIHEIYRLRCAMMNRLLRNADLPG